ncbi:F-box only protein 40 [Meriones unguiculatus]|uniref:F-box only protein 40 n=1 Tax=Meriones unguiculatus TaxID=10047 RepID=UPI000B4E87D8|nr:F-box only protein 40 [Meriones unguiculatus]XP_060226336.1 F-box only protein 40 [Meriones unguiculatus]XP_060226337.1 F-box only protein 40 [Meriones unguiculatus]
MGRARRPQPAQHRHCEGCVNRHCHVPVEPSVSCLVISCRLLCGATFHMCKEAEHALLCPLEQVPCLNSQYGCPLSMARHRLAKHLQACPASVVCCSMEWNRWPNVDSETVLHENIMKETPSEECLDTALALRDQKVLFRSLKMVDLFPETRDATEEEPAVNGDTSWEETGGAVGGVDGRPGPHRGLPATDGQAMELSQEERAALAKTKEGMDLARFGEWESMFSKEHAASVLTGSSAESEDRSGKAAGKGQGPGDGGGGAGHAEGSAEGRGPQESQKPRDLPAAMEMTGLAPWQDGVLERLKTAVDAKDYNMYLVHNGRMLIHFGQMPACTPKERDFVYGNLEAQEVKTVYTFKIPVSYCGKRARLGDAMLRCRPSEHKAVDTSDLGISVEDLPKSDLIKTTLQCALERELKGHVISESRSIDGLFMDLATQTYNFEPEQFSSDTVLADLLGAAQPGGLHVELHSECVTRRHNKSSSAFTFTCNKFFRRDEFPLHFKNVHTDIQSCLNGWFQHRCPLAYLGCTFVQNHFRPPGQKAKVIYSQELKTFAIKPEVAPELSEGRKSDHLPGRGGKSLHSLTSLPLEVLQYIAGFLDSISLSQLSQVSVLMRNICATLLQERGMVLLQWKKKRYSHGGTSWKVHSQIWQFSSLFSRIKSWEFNEVTSMSEHLKACPFNIVEHKTDPIRLTSMCQPQEQAQKSLVSTFRARPRGRHT